MVFCVVYVNVHMGLIVGLGAVSTTSVFDMPCKVCVLQSDQKVECAALCRNSLLFADICNDAHWGWQIADQTLMSPASVGDMCHVSPCWVLSYFFGDVPQSTYVACKRTVRD